MATLHSDTQSSQSSSFRQPSRLRKTASQHPGVAIFNLDSVLHDLWPTLVRIQPNGIRFDATQADPATLTEPTLFKASQEDLFDDLLNHTFLPRFPSPLHSPLPSPEFEASTFASEHHNHHSETSHPLAQSDVEDFGYFNMVKNRRSLQSILIPPFLQSSSSNESSPSPTRVRSLSAAASTLPAVPLSIPPSPALSPPISPPRNSPPSDLLDDDPFADLSSGPSVLSSSSSMSCANSTSRSSSALDALPSLSPSPRSPLSQHSFVETDDTSYPSFRTSSSSESPIDAPTVSLSSPPSLVSRSKSMGLPSRPRSSGHGQARPAHTRLAFKARPSLPSLHTLAQAQTVVPMVRRGRVGAQLPYEPWQSQSSAGADRAVHDEEISESVTCVPGLEMNEFVRRRPSLSRRPSGLSTIRDSSFLSGPLVASPVDFHASSETHSSYMDMDMDDHDVNDAFAAESSSRAEAWTHAELYADEDSTLLRADGPGLTRAHSEPYPSFRTLSGSQQLDPFCASPPDEATGTMPYDFPSPPHSSHIRRGSALINSSYSVLFPSHRYIDLTSPLDDFSIHHDLAQLEMSSHAALEAIGYPPSGQMGSGDAKHVAGDEFEPGTSAETIRTLNPSHRRTPSQQSQTLEWSPESSLLAGLPISPASTSSGSDRSSASGSQRAYDVESDHGVLEEDFLTFHSDSSEESLSPTLMSMSMSVSTTDSTVSSSTTRTPFSSSGNTPFNSIYEDQDAPFVLDEDVGCLAPPMPPLPKQLSRSSSTSSSDPGESKYVTAVEEAVDGGEGSGGGGRRSEHNGSYGGGSGNSRRGVGESSGGGGGDYSYGSSGGGHGGGRDGDDRRNRRPPVRTSFNAERDSEETSDSEDDYGFEEPSAKTRVAPPPRSAACEEQRSETDDDVPLARQIPTALKAQKTIRRQVRDENDMRRKKRAESKASSSVTVIPQVQPQPQAQQPRSRGYGSFNQESSALADAREALRATPSPNKPTTRTRTKTLPSNSVNPFSATDLRAKLMGISGFGSGKHSQQPSQELAPHPPMQFRAPPEPTANEGSRTLRPQRSFHRSRATESEHDPTAPPPVPLDANVKLGRSTTSVSRRGPPRQEMQPYPHEGHSSTLERARTSRSRRPSIEDEYQPTSSPRRPPLPPLPSAEVVTTFPSQQQQPLPPPKQTWQQRVFICGSQRYCQVEVDATTSIGDVLRILEKQGQLHGGPNLGPQAGWMVWEICHDFGMERPVRSFELLTSVSGSWVADKTTNTFMAKMTTLAPLLSRIAVPTSSPKFSGYVQHEYKRGKWQKRWLELREHSLWLSKKESGKDQVCLCSLHNFDAYTVTRVQKAPKGYVFAIKSTDNLSFFEDTSDYMHLFSCGEKEGANWLEKILLARSYVLYQDRNVLTNTNTASVGPTNNPGAALSRAGTRKRPTQPLLNIGPVQTHEVVAAPVFEPGSLLAKRAL